MIEHRTAFSGNPEDLSAQPKPQRRSFLVGLIIDLFREKPLGAVGLVGFLVFVVIALFANRLSPFDYREIDLGQAFLPPSLEHVLGTDDLGRDLLSRVIYGARVSLIVGIGGTIVSTLISVSIGLISGYFGGKLDLVIQRFVDAWFCFPPILIILTAITVIGQGLLQVIIVLGIFFGIRDTRIVRGAVIAIKNNLYVGAAGAVGCSQGRILLRHVLPNIMGPILVLMTLQIGQMITVEATVSFLGLSVPPPTPTWGNMLSGPARTHMIRAPWMALWPGLALSMTVYFVNILGDAIRDILDPKLRGSVGRYGKIAVHKNSKGRTMGKEVLGKIVRK